MELSRKITAATLSKGVALKGITEIQYLGRIAGFAKTVDKVTTQYGDSYRLNGEFVAIKPDGSQVMAATCYLPSVVNNLIVEALSDPNNSGVKFAFDVSAEPSEKSATGYVWQIKPLMEVTPSKGMLEFTNSLPAIGNSAVAQDNQKSQQEDAPRKEGKQKHK